MDSETQIIGSDTSFSKVKRPKFSGLDNSKFKSAFDIKINNWDFSLAKSLNTLKDGFRCKNLLVTGGAGFIGSNFINYILSKYLDLNVINIDNLTYAVFKKHKILWKTIKITVLLKEIFVIKFY